MSRIVFWGLIGGVLLALLELLEYQHFVRAYPRELYGGVIAALFAAAGLYLGLRSARGRRVVVIEEVRGDEATPFEPDTERLEELAITPREHEVLELIAEGLSNREIGERILVTENTVKTHAYRLFDKLGVRSRVQAVQRGRELRLLP